MLQQTSELQPTCCVIRLCTLSFLSQEHLTHSLRANRKRKTSFLTAFLHPGAKPFSASFPHQLPAPVLIFSLFTCLKVLVLVTHHKQTLRHPVCISNSPVALSIPSSFNTLSNRSSLSSFETTISAGAAGTALQAATSRSSDLNCLQPSPAPLFSNAVHSHCHRLQELILSAIANTKIYKSFQF